MTVQLKKLLLSLMPFLLPAGFAMAASEQADQHASATEPSALMVRVAVDAEGHPIADTAEMRLYTGEAVDVSQVVNPEQLWTQGSAVTPDQVMRAQDDSASQDQLRIRPRRFFYWPYGGYYYYYYYYPYYYPYYPYYPYPYYGW